MTECLSHRHTNVQSEGLRFAEMSPAHGLAETARTGLYVVSMGSDVTGWNMFYFLLIYQQWGGEWLAIRGGKREVTKNTGRPRHGQGAQSSPLPMKNPVRCSGCGQVRHPVP